jgi:hypothetical protein
MDDTTRVAIVRAGPLHPDDAGPPVRYEIGDHLGDAVVTVDGTGAWVNREEYFPYGETSFGSFAASATGSPARSATRSQVSAITALGTTRRPSHGGRAAIRPDRLTASTCTPSHEEIHGPEWTRTAWPATTPARPSPEPRCRPTSPA